MSFPTGLGVSTDLIGDKTNEYLLLASLDPKTDSCLTVFYIVLSLFFFLSPLFFSNVLLGSESSVAILVVVVWYD